MKASGLSVQLSCKVKWYGVFLMKALYLAAKVGFISVQKAADLITKHCFVLEIGDVKFQSTPPVRGRSCEKVN